MRRLLLIIVLICSPIFAASPILNDSIHFTGVVPGGFNARPELVTNGDFSTAGADIPGTEVFANWANTDNATAGITVSKVNNACRIQSDSTFVEIVQTGIVTEGVTYRIEFDVTEAVSGGISVVLSGNTLGSVGTVGTHVFHGVNTGGDFVAFKRASGAADMTIDNVSVTKAGELITDPGFDDASAWTVADGATVDGGVCTYVHNAAGSFVAQDYGAVQGTTYRVSYQVLANTGIITGEFVLSSSGIFGSIQIPITVGTHVVYAQAVAGAPVQDLRFAWVSTESGDTMTIDNVSVTVASLGTNMAFGTDDLTDWTDGGSNWAAGTGAAVHTAGATETLTSDTVTVVADTMYRIKFKMASRTAGSVTVGIGAITSVPVSANVLIVQFLRSADTTAFTITPTNDFDGSIDDIQVEEWFGDVLAGGGCTLATYTGDLNDYMGANGEVLHNDLGLALSNAAGSLAIAAATTWDTTPTVGTLVQCDFSATFTDGVYEITAASASSITIDLSSGGLAAETVEVWIGGSYPSLDNKLSHDEVVREATDTNYYSRHFVTNVPQENASTMTVQAETSDTTAKEQDAHVSITGFNITLTAEDLTPDVAGDKLRLVSDMDEGQTYYGGALSAFWRDEGFNDENPNGAWIELTELNGNDVFTVTSDMVDFANLKLIAANIDTDSGFTTAADRDFCTFSNIWFGKMLFPWTASAGSFINSLASDNYIGREVATNSTNRIFEGDFLRCVFNGTGKSKAATVASGGFTSDFEGCLLYKGTVGTNAQGGIVIRDCTLYGQSSICLEAVNASHYAAVINTIMNPLAAADIGLNLSTASVSPMSSNNIFWSAAGAMTNPIVHADITNPSLTRNSLIADPQFRNAADGKFDLQSGSPAIGAGSGGGNIGAGAGPAIGDGYRSRYE